MEEARVVLGIAGMKPGKYEYDFEVGKAYFEMYEYSSLKQGNLTLNVKVDRNVYTMSINMEVKGSVNVECDHCTGEMPLTISGKLEILGKISNEEVDHGAMDDEDFMMIDPIANELDLSKHVYDLIYMSLPLKRVCEKPGDQEYCNQEILKKLESYKTYDDGLDGESDPRWDKLKDLLN